MRYTLFVDDSRIETLGISSLGGLLISETEYEKCQLELRDIKTEHLGDPHAPIKWSPGNDAEYFQKQRGLRNQNDFRETVCDLIGRTDLVVMAVGIDEQDQDYHAAQRERYLLQGLEYLCQRTQMHLNAINGTANVVVEFPGTGLEAPLSKRYWEIRRMGSVSPFFDLKLDRLDRTLAFSHDFLCEGIQLADIAIGAICHATKSNRFSPFDRFRHNIRRAPHTQQVKGWGIVVYPSNSSVMDEVCRYCQTSDDAKP